MGGKERGVTHLMLALVIDQASRSRRSNLPGGELWSRRYTANASRFHASIVLREGKG